MILNDFTVPKTKFSNEQLDAVLAELCGIVIKGQQDNPDFNGMVAAAVIDPTGRLVTGLNYLYGNYRVHAERAAIDKYEEEYGELPRGSIVVTTLSPCSDRMDSRYEESCTNLLNSKGVKLAYCGYKDPSQENIQDKFVSIFTENPKIKHLCSKFAHTFLDKGITEESSKQILSYIKKIHPKGEFTIDQSITDHPEWGLTSVPLSTLHIESDDVSPYGQINHIDYDHVSDITVQDIKNKPIVVDNKGWIIDGNHRAVAARDMGMTHIPAYVPVEQEDDEQETYAQHMARIKGELAESKVLPLEIEEFLDSLMPDDVGVEEFGPYRVHYEGFTDDCKSSKDYRRDPEAVYQQVFNDFIAREGGRKPVIQDMVGDEEYPILYSVFEIPHQVKENFADGKGPGRPGDSQRHGIPKGATISQLEKASHAKGRKGQLARWQLNMRRGKKK